ncbi:MAG: DNA repair protein RecN [Thiotrichaceae bacterium]|nr:DNA repair protein RecN [Thiotrichaceae bacterium]PCI11154.1 MAG: DNA repair protein RecN [Thiotrichales bacterium]PCI12872.1 MAG: DNA repair protein RecN [Thiotrichales bacterium]
MLSQLHIRNFAIVDRLDLDFNADLSVLTGETGTGKSILIDALGLVLGDRADSDMVRHGAARAEICATFELHDATQAAAWLHTNELDDDSHKGECQLRRTITKEGRSKAYINGRPTTVQIIRELGEQLVDIHGQHEHQSLVKRDEQRRLLDHYAHHKPLTNEVATTFRLWQKISREFETLNEAARSRDQQMILLRHQTEELQTLNLTTRSLQKLEDEHKRLANAGQLINTYQSALTTLDDDDHAIAPKLQQISAQLQPLLDSDKQLTTVIEMINGAAIQIDEATHELRHQLESLELDPQRLSEVDQQLSDIHDTARKHRMRPKELPGHYQTLCDELASLDNADATLEQLEKEIEVKATQYQKLANKLRKGRRSAAKKLNKLVTENMHKLGMPGGEFEITVTPYDDDKFTVHGTEQIEFLVKTNPNQIAKALSKVASGGELSRISLAIQVITSQQGAIPTLIFDEVDVGIGGRVAEIVGQKLRELGTSRQVLCVTHLPQVAALGHHHLQVQKQHSAKQVETRVQVLNETARNEEIARMLGGIEITEQTRAHANEMIMKAQQQP